MEKVKIFNVRGIVQIDDKKHFFNRRAKKYDELELGKTYHYVVRTHGNSSAMIAIGSDNVHLKANSMMTITDKKKSGSNWKKVKSLAKYGVGMTWYGVQSFFGTEKPEEPGGNAVIGVRA